MGKRTEEEEEEREDEENQPEGSDQNGTEAKEDTSPQDAHHVIFASGDVFAIRGTGSMEDLRGKEAVAAERPELPLM